MMNNNIVETVYLKYQIGDFYHLPFCKKEFKIIAMPHMRYEEREDGFYLLGSYPPRKQKGEAAMWVTGIVNYPKVLREPDNRIWQGVMFCSNCHLTYSAEGFRQLNSHILSGPSLGKECPWCGTPIYNYKGNGGVVSFDIERDIGVSQKLRAWILAERRTACLNVQSFTYKDIPIIEDIFDKGCGENGDYRDALEYIVEKDREENLCIKDMHCLCEKCVSDTEDRKEENNESESD